MDINILKEKWWYRLVKVAYFVALALFVLIAFVVVYDSAPYEVIDQKNSYVTCNSTQKSFYVSDLDIYISTDFNDVPYVLNDEKVLKKCRMESLVAGQISLDQMIELNNSRYQISNYEITTVYKLNRSYADVILENTAFIFFGLLFFEILRRIFFYITTGKFLIIK